MNKKIKSMFFILSIFLLLSSCHKENTQVKESSNTEDIVSISEHKEEDKENREIIAIDDEIDRLFFISKKDIKTQVYDQNLGDDFLNSKLNFAIVDANIASKIYNSSKGSIKIASINSFATYKLISKDVDFSKMKSYMDLVNKKIYIDKNEKDIINVLDKYAKLFNITPIDIENEKKVKEVLYTKNTILFLSEPHASHIIEEDGNISFKLDLEDVWLDNTGDKMPGKVLIVKTDFLEKNPETVKSLLEVISKSVDIVNKKPEEALSILKNMELYEDFNKDYLNNLNFTFIKGKAVREIYRPYIAILNQIHKQLSGDEIPSDDFYVNKE